MAEITTFCNLFNFAAGEKMEANVIALATIAGVLAR